MLEDLCVFCLSPSFLSPPPPSMNPWSSQQYFSTVHIHFHLIPFNKGGLIGPALLGARLSPPSSSFLLPPPSMDFCVCSYLVHLVHIKSIYILLLSLWLVRDSLVEGNMFSFSYEGPCTIVYPAVMFWVILWLILFYLQVLWLFVQLYDTWIYVTL